MKTTNCHRDEKNAPKIKKIKTPKGKTQMTDLRTLFPLI